MPVSFCIRDWAVWTPEIADRGAFENAQGDFDFKGKVDCAPEVRDLPMMLRRRLSPLGKMAMRVAYDVDCDKDVALVFSSRYGESAQTVKLLQSLAVDEPLSPAGFSMSVHNGLAGLLSIVTKNTKPHTAISAGKASFCNALLEAAAQLHCTNDSGVLLVHYDEPLPAFYCLSPDEEITPLALALYLEKDDGDSVDLSCQESEEVAEHEDAALSFLKNCLGKKKDWCWSDGRTQWMCTYAITS